MSACRHRQLSKDIPGAGDIYWTIWRTQFQTTFRSNFQIRNASLGDSVEAISYLYAIAAAGMSFAGLSVLTMILRQMLGGQMTKFDTFVARSWIQLGFLVTFGAIVPPLLGLFELPAPMVWRISSASMAIIL